MTAAPAILAATDFSVAARHAADRAARVAQDSGGALTLLHVLPGGALQSLRQWLGADSSTERQLHDDAQRGLAALAARLHERRGLAVQTLQAIGAVADEIERQAAALDAGLLVLGARGAGFLRRLVLGSTAERLMRRTSRPLLVVRQTPHEPYRQALVALDFSPWSAGAIPLARRVAPQARLLLLHVFEVPFEDKLRFAGVDAAVIEHYRSQARAQATQRLYALAQACGLAPGEWSPLIVEGDASLRIVEHEQEHDCDLVVLGKHGQSAVEDLLLGSVSKHVLAEGSTDVLVSTARDDG
jgi:nucleotide-binding universal stress UspA family protein